MRIDFLKDNPVLALRLSELCGNEWEHLYVDWDRAVALREFESQRADGRLPLSLVAIEGNELLGMVSLVFDDLPDTNISIPGLPASLSCPNTDREELAHSLSAKRNCSYSPEWHEPTCSQNRPVLF